ncbi:MAG: protein BatD, partial [Ignavibacteriales bacterium]|nr:protein BatD [Ignavibacteriales bacterium]
MQSVLNQVKIGEAMKPSYKLYLILLYAVLFLSPRTGAQQLSASVSQNPVALGEMFELTITYSGSDVNGLSAFNPPSMPNFMVMSGPNQSTSMQIINGAVSGSRSFSYYLQAKEKGKFTIGSASVVNSGKTYKSQPIVIEVVQGSAKPKQQQQGGGDAQTSSAEIGENVFIRAYADKSTAFYGEQINITYKLYTRLRLSTPQISKLPSYPGFWAEEIAMPQTLQAANEVLNGKKFVSYTIKQVALFASQTGELSVTPFKLKIPVTIEKRRKSNNPFDDFFNDPFFAQAQTVEYEAVSNTLKVQVKPLPEQDKPANFSGAVGNFTMDVKADKSTGKQNEPIALTVTVSGTGNLQLLGTPELNLPPTIEKYDPKINEDINRSGTIGGRKSFEFLLVPRVEGRQEIPPVSFSYFNIQKKKYETINSNPIELTVQKGDGSFAGGSTLAKERVNLLGQDIHYIKTRLTDVLPAKYSFVQNPVAWVLFAFPFLSLAGVAAFRFKQGQKMLNKDFVRNKKAEKLAKAKLKNAAKAIQANQVDLFYTELSAGLTGYAENKFAIDRADLTIDSLRSQLQALNFTEEIVNEFCSTIEKCEYARFAPSTDKQAGMQQLYEAAKNLIVKIESG